MYACYVPALAYREVHVHRGITQTGVHKIIAIETVQAVIRINRLHGAGSDSKFSTGNAVPHVEPDQRVIKIPKALRPENVFR